MFAFLKRFVRSEAGRKAIRTFVISTLTLFVPGLLGFLHGLTEWANSQGATAFPDAHGLAYLGVSAIVGGVIAVTNYVWILVENYAGKGMLREVPEDPQAQ